MITNKKAIEVNHYYILKNIGKQFTLLILRKHDDKLANSLNELFLLSNIFVLFVGEENKSQVSEIVEENIFPAVFFFVNGKSQKLNTSADDIISSIITSQFRKLISSHRSNTPPLGSYVGKSENKRLLEGDALVAMTRASGAYKSLVYGKVQHGSAIRTGTGKLSLDNKMIYCGDIVKILSNDDSELMTGVVVFFNAAFFILKYTEDSPEPMPILMADLYSKDMVIVSSIFINNSEDEQFRNNILKPAKS